MTTPKVHVLDHFTDDERSSALTILVNGVRFHIIADVADLTSRSKHGRAIQFEYSRIVDAVKGKHHKDRTGKDQSENEYEELWCTCRKPENGNRMIECESGDCQYQWFHFSCVGIETAPEGEWICPTCRESSPSSDSGVDVATPEEIDVSPVFKVTDSDDEQAEQRLQNWMLSPFGSILAPLAAHKEPQRKSVLEWYNPTTHFYTLKIKGSRLEPIELEDTNDLKAAMNDLLPSVDLPKSMTRLDIPFHNPAELTVLEESDMLGPLHPSRVALGDEQHFIKMVDPSQAQCTKREIEILHQIKKLGLHEKFNVPQVLGLVGDGTSKSKIMGFLQTDIPSPKPLTQMLDEEVSQRKRDKWAKESKRIVDLLHDHDIIFGDCKADNFLVDKNDELWVIDFGGSYTEGWIEPKLAETEEGDDMALEKLVNALHDPVAYTMEASDEADETETSRTRVEEDRKRKRKTCEDWEADYERSTKSRKAS